MSRTVCSFTTVDFEGGMLECAGSVTSAYPTLGRAGYFHYMATVARTTANANHKKRTSNPTAVPPDDGVGVEVDEFACRGANFISCWL
jgi:hypothetical protein